MPAIVPSYGNPEAKIMLVGEAPGKSEVEKMRPFIGASGQELDKMLAEAGIARDACFTANVCRHRPRDNQIKNFFRTKTAAKKEGIEQYMGKYPTKEIVYGHGLLIDEIDKIRPNVIAAFGATALWALTGEGVKGNTPQPTGIGTWRSSQMDAGAIGFPNIKVIPTYHPASLFRMWENRPIVVHDLKRIERESHFREQRLPAYNFSVRPSFREAIGRLNWIIEELNRAESEGHTYALSCDIETRLRNIACIGFAWSSLDAICIPLMSTQHIRGYWAIEEEVALVQTMKEIFDHPALKLIGQNFDYDAQYIAKSWGIFAPPDFDTMIAQHVLFPGMRKGLDYISSMYCEYHRYWKDEGKEWDPHLHDEEDFWTYNCKDAVTTYEAAIVEEDLILSFDLLKPFKFQMRQVIPILHMEMRGCAQDLKRKSEVMVELMDYMNELEALFEYTVPHEIHARRKNIKPWYRSPKQQMTLFYKTLGQQEIVSMKTKRPTCDDEALVEIGIREPALRPLTDALAAYRSAGTLVSNFFNAPQDPDMRFHTSYNMTGTETFRYSSSQDAFHYGGNSQNLTSGDEDE